MQTPRLADYIAHAMIAHEGYQDKVQWPDKILGEAIAPYSSRNALPNSLMMIEAGLSACAMAPDLFEPYKAAHPHKDKAVRGFKLIGKPRDIPHLPVFQKYIKALQAGKDME